MTKAVKGYKRMEWQKVREGNEALDCQLSARAAAARVGIDRSLDKHWAGPGGARLGSTAAAATAARDAQPTEEPGAVPVGGLPLACSRGSPVWD